MKNTDTPLISVIVPVYKTEKYIHRCVDSILNQTYKNIEIILVDDGSPDNCGKICDEYAEKYNHILVIHQKNAGLSEARNAGLKISTGNFVAFVDSDDYILDQMYETMMACMLKTKVDIVVCQWQYEKLDGTWVINKEKICQNIYGYHDTIEFADYLYKCQGGYENGVVVAAWNKLYMRRVFDNVKFEGIYNEDDRINDKINSQNYKIFVLEEFLYIYVQNQGSLTNSSFSEKQFLFLEILNERAQLFRNREYIYIQTLLLYINMYIEYYYKAKEYGLDLSKEYRNIFNSVFISLLKTRKMSLKLFIRGILFSVFPRVYQILIAIK